MTNPLPRLAVGCPSCIDKPQRKLVRQYAPAQRYALGDPANASACWTESSFLRQEKTTCRPAGAARFLVLAAAGNARPGRVTDRSPPEALACVLPSIFAYRLPYQSLPAPESQALH